MANALTKADREGLIDDDMEVMLQSDSAVALGILLRLVPGAVNRPHENSAALFPPRRSHAWRGLREEAAAVITEIAARRRLAIVIRHVRGHTAGGGRQWVNRQVDAAARTHVRAARKSKRKLLNG